MVGGSTALCALAIWSCFAGVGQWKTYTSKRQVRDVAIDRTTIWAATSGGLFSYSTLDQGFSQFATAEGLKTTDLTALTVDGSGNIWIGAANGMLQRYDPRENSWDFIPDISVRLDPQKRINALKAQGDTLFVISEIGVSLFSISRMEFTATYSRFGPGPTPLVGGVTDMEFFNGFFWITTHTGSASTPVGNPNPSSPDSWQVFTTSQGLPSNRCNGLVIYSDTLFAATGNGVAFFRSPGWAVLSGTLSMNVLGIAGGTQAFPGIAFITVSQEYLYNSSGLQLFPHPFGGSPVSLVSIQRPDLIGAQSQGVLFYENQWNRLVPPGPPSNKFVGIAVDDRGVVYSGTGTANGDGFMSFNGSSWRSYTADQDPRLGPPAGTGNNYYKVSIGWNNAKWVSGWGSGVALLDDPGNIIRVFNATNGLPPTDNFRYIVVGGVATDPDGVAYITNRTAGDSTAVVLFHPDSTLTYNVRLSMRDPLRVFTDVVIDDYGTKWFANFSRFEPEAPIALFYYNESYHLPGTVNGWGSLTDHDGLASNKVGALAVDRDNQVWVGSEKGISIIYEPSFPAGNIAAYHPLSDQNIQGILVDPLNNKWVATKQGVFILPPDGTSILDHLTAENTDGKLLDDDVASIAINRSDGTLYFGTEKGLSSLSTTAVMPNRTYDDLSFAPNPFYLPSSTMLTIDGLVEGSSLKILTIDGRLVREIHSPGGRVGFWDGRNDAGELVASAVYLVVAFSEDGSTVATGKVAVVRR